MSKTNLLSNPKQNHQPGRKRRFGLQSYARLFGIAFILSILIAACTSQAEVVEEIAKVTEAAEALKDATEVAETAEVVEVMAEAVEEEALVEVQADFPTGDFEKAQQRITFMPDGTFTVWIINIESFDVEDGRYTIDGSQITMQDEVCDPEEGNYTWQFDGTYLSFDLIEDACDGRLQALKTGKWLHKP
jgi:hypothetical protein